MKKWNGFLSVRGAVALASVFVFILWAAAQYSGENPRTVSGPEDLRTELRRVQLLFPPSDSAVQYDAGTFLRTSGSGGLEREFVSGLVSRLEPDGTEAWPVTVYEESPSGDTVVLNADGAVACRLSAEKDVDPAWTLRFLFPGWPARNAAHRHDSARVLMSAKLVEQRPASHSWSGGTGHRPASAPKGCKNYLVVWNSSSNIWLGADSGAAGSVAMIDVGYSHGVALHDDGSLTRVGLDPASASVTEQRFPSAGAMLATAGALGDTLVLGFDGALRHVSAGGELLGIRRSAGNVGGIVSGTGFFLALGKGGRLLSWGADGVLAPPAGLPEVAAIDAGESFGVVRRHTGEVVAWGDPRLSTNIASGVTSVSASRRGSHCLALKKNGTVAAWGDDGFGQCRVPNGLGDVAAVAAGGYHSVALRRDGTVACWGLVKGAPPFLTNVTAVSASYLDVCAVTGDGTVAVFGRGCPLGGSRLQAKTAGACEILDAKIVDCGIYLAVVRAREGSLEGDADGDGVPGVEEVFVLGTDPLLKDAGIYAPPPAAEPETKATQASTSASKTASAQKAAARITFASKSGGTTYFTDASKEDDSGDGLSWNTAKRTIQAAVDLGQAGDTVLVTNGVYSEGDRATPGGLFGNRLVITNGVRVKSVNGAGATVIQGSGSEYFDTPYAVRCVFISDGIIEGFTLQGGAAVAHWTSPDQRDKSGGCLNMGTATAASEARNCVIADGAAYDGGGVWGGRLVNCLIRNCNAYYPAGADGCTLVNCTVTGNGGWSASGGARGCAITNSIIYGNNGYESPNCHSCSVSCSCSDPDNYGMFNESDGVIFADPLFGDAANGDFTLQSASPCVNAGSNLYVAANVDLDGVPRIQGDAVDLGAYEFVVHSDSDGVPDYLDAFPSDAAAWLDTDGDGLPDEVHAELNPYTNLVEDTDDDNDGLPDWWETRYASYGFDPLVPAPGDSSESGLYGDNDDDGLDNLQEAQWGTNPTASDTDGDGFDDTEELYGQVIEWGEQYNCSVPRPAHLGALIQVAAGRYHLSAVRTDGTVVCWGSNLGNCCVPPASATNIKTVAAGAYYNIAIRKNGSVLCWGENTYGKSTPPSDLTNVLAASAGYAHSLAVRSDGTVCAWGQNASGQCNVPSGLTNVIAVAAGSTHSAALCGDGHVVCWGNTNFAKCVVPANLTNAVAIAVGYNHTAALKADGSVVCWGATNYCMVPAGLTNGVRIGAGGSHTLAYLSDGRIVAWGYNSSGQCAQKFSYSPALSIGGGYRSSMVFLQGVTDPNNADSDDDMINDRDEVVTYGTNPLNPDTDGDGVSDGPADPDGPGAGIAAGPDAFPFDPAAWLDTDGDGTPNELHGQSTTGLVEDTDDDNDGVADGAQDPDGTGPIIAGPDAFPLDPAAWLDTDGDGLPDELHGMSLTDLVEDTDDDDDGIDDAKEVNTTNLYYWPKDESLDKYFTVTNAVSLDAAIAAKRLHCRLASGEILVVDTGYSAVPSYKVPCITNPVCFDVGSGHGSAVLTNGVVRTWQNSGSMPFVTNCTFASAAKEVSCGWGFTLVLLEDRTVRSVPFFQFASGSSAYPSVTNVPSGLSGVAAIASGEYHCLALLTNGQVVAWGRNDSGECVVPANVVDAVAIDAGQGISLALLRDGQVVAWGTNGWEHVTCAPSCSGIRALSCGKVRATALLDDTGNVCSWGHHPTNYSLGCGIRKMCGKHSSLSTAFITEDGFGKLIGLLTRRIEGVRAIDMVPHGDGAFAIAATDPLRKDSDGDGLNDGWELKYGLNPLSRREIYKYGDPVYRCCWDMDLDGLSNLQEQQLDTDPCDPDSDNDNVSDGPLDPDGAGPVVAGPDAFPHDPAAW